MSGKTASILNFIRNLVSPSKQKAIKLILEDCCNNCVFVNIGDSDNPLEINGVVQINAKVKVIIESSTGDIGFLNVQTDNDGMPTVTCTNF